MSNALPAPAIAAGGSLTETFGGTSHSLAGVESAAVAAAAQAKAAVEARYIMALRRPRNWDEVRQKILAECRRPSFANNKSTLYRKPIGTDGVEGLGIRFAELALRCMTNCLIESAIQFEDSSKEVTRVTLTDLESNTTYPMDVRITKTVERSKPMDDGSYISVRKNARGSNVFHDPGHRRRPAQQAGAAISKALRTLALRLIPGDIQDEAEAIIRAVREAKAAADPEAERKAIADAFYQIGVRAADLAEYLGHDLATCNPTEMVELRGIYGAIRDGEASWQQAIESRREQRKAREAGKDAPGESGRPPAPLPGRRLREKPPGLGKGVRSGRRTPDKIIENLSSRFTLSAEQAATLRALAQSPAAGANQSGEAAANAGVDEKAGNAAGPGQSAPFSPDQIKQGIEDAIGAQDADKLAEWGDLIGSVPDPADRRALAAAYSEAEQLIR